jgi:hypothetical protein
VAEETASIQKQLRESSPRKQLRGTRWPLPSETSTTRRNHQAHRIGATKKIRRRRLLAEGAVVKGAARATMVKTLASKTAETDRYSPHRWVTPRSPLRRISIQPPH